MYLTADLLEIFVSDNLLRELNHTVLSNTNPKTRLYDIKS